MTKQELIAEVAKRADITKKDAELVVKYTFETITEALERGDKFQLVGFGTFDVAERAAREARNPRDGSVMQSRCRPQETCKRITQSKLNLEKHALEVAA